MKNVLRIAAVGLCCAALVACSQKEPADAALKAADVAMSEVKTDGARYAPEQTKGLMASYTAAQEAFGKGDYKAAMELAQGVPAKARDVAAAVAAKKAELTKAWTELATSGSAQIDQIRAKVGELSAMKKLPKGMDAAALEAAKTTLADVTKTWGEAADAFKSGNLMAAVAAGNTVKTKVAEAMGSLGLTPAAPAAAAAPAPAPPAKK
jgi:hypothetical protein